MSNQKANDNAQEISEIYARPNWKNWVQVMVIGIIFLLNISMVMSNLDLHRSHVDIPFHKEALSYLLLLLFDLTIFFPILLEVHTVKITANNFVLKTLFWTVSLPWQDIVKYRYLQYFKYGIVRTSRCLYLIKRRDIKEFDHLTESIMLKIKSLGCT